MKKVLTKELAEDILRLIQSHNLGSMTIQTYKKGKNKGKHGVVYSQGGEKLSDHDKQFLFSTINDILLGLITDIELYYEPDQPLKYRIVRSN